MPNLDVCTLGASHVDGSTGAVMVQCTVDDKGEESFGEIPLYQCLGVTSVPYAPDDNGAAEGVVVESVAGLPGVVVGGRDARTADVVAQMGPGESCLHSTGRDFDSRVFCKKQMIAIVVGDDLAFVLDRKSKAVTLAAFGHAFSISKDGGAVMTDETGGASIQLKNGMVCITGQVVLGGRTPTAPMLAGLSGPAAVAVPGVFAGK